jgi:TonB family protein
MAVGLPHTCAYWYPASAMRAGKEGSVLLSFVITTSGTVRNPKVEASSGYPDLDRAAMDCASGFLYSPTVRRGKPVEVPWRMRIEFCITRGCEMALEYLRPPSNPKGKQPQHGCPPIASVLRKGSAV